ncbi:MAG: DUF1097 domain-containing protein [Rickettsiales bacterium]|jgi:hypothetical protein|nr:DUF1097 domain-containing protein [Rickettsiales bacterium]
MTLLEIVSNKEKRFKERIKELQEFLNGSSEILVNKELFTTVLSTKAIVDVRKQMVYLILRHCIERDSARSEKGERLSFQSVMDILNEATRRFIIPEYFHGLINFRDQSRNTLLHQAVTSNNTEAITTILKREYGANPLIENGNKQIPLALAQGKTRDALVNSMTDLANSKKWSVAYNSLFGVIPGVFLGVGLGVGSALVPSMAIILGAAAVSTFVVGIAIGLAISFLSQDYKQAKAIEKAINSEPSSVNNKISFASVNDRKGSQPT